MPATRFDSTCRRLASCVVLALAGAGAFAAQATPLEVLFEQPGGPVFPGGRGGDEFFNYAHAGGYLIQQDPGDGFWYHLVRVGMTIVVSPARVMLDPPPPGAATLADIDLLRPQPSPPVPHRPVPGVAPAPVGPPLSPTEPLIVFYVGFTNVPMSFPDSQWASSTFPLAGKTIASYYSQASRNSFTFVAAGEGAGTVGDGVVSMVLPRVHPDPSTGVDDRNRQIVADALTLADPVVNYAAFDTNSDSVLSSNELHLLVIVAGEEEACTGTATPGVWGHHWALFGTVPAPLLDGVLVGGGGYAQVGELHGFGVPATIGVMCHELGHDLGLPDLYDLDGSSEGIGNWGLMGSGNWGFVRGEGNGVTPVLPCAWSRIRLGFMTPTPIFTAGVYFVDQASDAFFSNVLQVSPTAAPATEYFLVENRQLTGFDAGLDGLFWIYGAPGGYAGGLSIWHVDDTQVNNDTESRKWVDLEEANEGIVGSSELDTRANRGTRQHLFYSGHVTGFTDATTPGATLYSTLPSSIQMTGVSSSAGQMSLSIGGSGLPGLQPPSCVITAPGAWTTGSGDIAVVFNGSEPVSQPIGAVLDWSADGGATWNRATPAPSSPIGNPVPPRPTPFVALTFIWDTLADARGLGGPQAIDFRITVSSVTSAGSCVQSWFVDNSITTLCAGTCGDCDANGLGPNILDALTAAQISVGVIVPTTQQTYCCDVNSAAGVGILDALIIAQFDVGLPVALLCP